MLIKTTRDFLPPEQLCLTDILELKRLSPTCRYWRKSSNTVIKLDWYATVHEAKISNFNQEPKQRIIMSIFSNVAVCRYNGSLLSAERPDCGP